MGQSGFGSNGNEWVLHIPKSARTGASPSDAAYCHIQDTYSTAVVQSAYSTAPSRLGDRYLVAHSYKSGAL